MSFVHHLMHLVPAVVMVTMVVMMMIMAVLVILFVLVVMMVVVMFLAMLVMVMVVMVVVSLAMLVIMAMVMFGEHLKHLWALVVAIVVARCAGLVASMHFHDFWALSRKLLECTFGFFCKFLVHPLQLELWTIITSCFLACFMASFDGREIFASLHERNPWFWALGMAICRGSALLFASHSLLPHFGELLVPASFVVIVVVILISTLFVMCLPHREQLHGTLIKHV